MLPKLEQEIWVSQFAEVLIEKQSRFPIELARSIALSYWPHLGIVKPLDAVLTILDWAVEVHEQELRRGEPPSAPG